MVQFMNLLSEDKDFIEGIVFEDSIPVIIYHKATSRFIQSDLYKKLVETGVKFKIITRKEYEYYAVHNV